MIIKSRFLLVFYLVLIVLMIVWVLGNKGTSSNYRVVGVSKGLVEVSCAKPKVGSRCTAPDPDRIAFYVRALDHSIGMPTEKYGYGTEVTIGLFVSDAKAESIYEHGSEAGNYLIGSDNNVRIYYSALNELESKLKWYSHWGKYAAVVSDVVGYDKYDNISCPSIVALVSKKATEVQRITCGVIRRALYVPKANPNKIIDCHQYLGVDGVLRLRGCTVHSDLAMGGRVEYAINSKFFLNGKLVSLDKKITGYLNGILISTEGK
ncbi:hypothetical protein [Pseudomonas sp. M30-35]|uniref:hypothetical protein n=1 Tax=Pseudomonas sp. M30-35 TaxID=1981174 RepID=UPI0012FDA716|nr:hypothetical protein [Pseudomonas sp. M30-35]